MTVHRSGYGIVGGLVVAAMLLLSRNACALQLEQSLTWPAATSQTRTVGSSVQVSGTALSLPLQFDQTLASQTGEAVGGDRQRLFQAALSYLGVRYRFGQQDESGIDCSGLIQSVFGSVGYSLPRSTAEQIHDGAPVSDQNIRPGDLLFYRWHRNQLHVALYMSDGLILHASPTAGKVILTRLVGDWRKRLVAVRRVM